MPSFAKYRLLLMTNAHIDECVRLFIDVFQNEPWNYVWLKQENSIRYYNDLMKTPKFQGFVYMLDKQTVGVCLGIVNDYFASKTYEIREIFVNRHMQNRGLGSSMLNEIKTVLNAQGINAITLFTQRHIPAYDFYIKNGFSVSDETVFLCKPLI